MMNINKLVNDQRKYYLNNNTKDIDSRIKTLNKIYDWILSNEDLICDALKKDLNKSDTESYMTEIGNVLNDIKYQIKHIKRWSRTKVLPASIMHFPSISYKYSEPYGVTLVMGTWNYPFLLSVSPAIDSIIAGNTVVIKPSSYSPYTASVIKKLFDETCDRNLACALDPSKIKSSLVLEEKFDYVFFTGSAKTGSIVMKKCAETLTPVTLELGGKSPCIVDDIKNIDTIARRIVFGKYLNAGQTCIAVDYIFVKKELKSQLVESLIKQINLFFGKNALTNPEYVKIINEKHFERLIKLLNKEHIIYGGKYNEKTLKIEPTIIDNVNSESNIMKEEIFGPILPIMTYESIDEVIDYIQNHDKPLACYIFSSNKKIQEKIITNCSFGGGCINDTIIHVANNNLSFGGVGKSGMGSYHGKNSFNTFTHEKCIVKKSKLIDIKMRYYPFNKSKLKMIKKILK